MAETKKPENKQPDKPVTEPVKTQTKLIGNWKTGQLFWGVLLIVVGILILLNNFDLVEVRLFEILRLWPLLIVAAGLSVLSLKGWVGRTLSALFLVATIAAVCYVALGFGPNTDDRRVNTQDVSIQTVNNEIQSANVTVRAGAGKLYIRGANIDNVLDARLESDFMTIDESSSVQDDTQVIELDVMGRQGNWSFRHWKNDLTVNLTNDLPMELAVDAGASDIKLDLADTMLSELDIDSGASSTDIKLGDKVDQLNVRIDSGASSTSVAIPEDVGVQIEIDSGLTSKDLADLKKVGENTYQSPGFDDAKQQIIITGSLGMASFSLSRY